MFDFILKGGFIVDGTGAPGYIADIGLKEGMITAIGDLSDAECAELIDVSNKYVAPGFIDAHSHSDLSVFMRWRAENILEQGITTEIAGNCGVSISPMLPYDFGAIPFEIAPDASERLGKTDGSTRAVMAEIESGPLSANIAYYIGHGAIRGKVLGYQNRKPDKAEMDAMKALLREGMESGALGLSTGLIYPPGSYSDTDEIIELCKVCADYGGLYATHLRNEGNRVVESVKEAIRIGAEAGVRVIISHHKIAGMHNEGLSRRTLKLAQDARDNGQEVYFDQYPYDGGATSLLSALPPRFAAEGMDVLIQKLKDPGVRAEIKALLSQNSSEFENMIYASGPDGIYVSGLTSDSELNGKTLSEIAAIKEKDIYDTLFSILSENRKASAIYRMTCQWDIDNILKCPYTMIGTDSAQAQSLSAVFTQHPRGVGTFPKIIGQYCRDKKLFGIEECIRKMTGLPASAIGLATKGSIAVGKDADIVVFDFDKIDGKSTYGKLVPNEGIDLVFVSGRISVKNGKRTATQAGKLLRRRDDA